MIGQLLMNLLQVDQTTGLSANITDSGGAFIKVYHWNVWQGNAHPAIVYHELGKTGNRDKSGISKADDVQVQVTTWHLDDSEAATIANNIRTVLEGWSGTYDSVNYYKTILQSEVETFEPKLQMPGKVQTWLFSYAR